MNNIPAITDKGITITVALAKALLQFAATDESRRALAALGFDDCHVAATDGHTAARMMNLDVSGTNGAVPSTWNGRYWPAAHVKALIKSAGKAETIFLAWDACGDAEIKFPPVSRAMPSDRKIKSGEAIGLCPRYLARIEAVSDALRGKRPKKGPDNAEVALVSAPGPLDPTVWEVRGFAGEIVEIAIHTRRL